MDTVVTRVTGAWTDLTAAWAAATPAAADGEVITVQPADAGSSQAIEIIQAAAEPGAGERGHLLAGCDTLALTGASGRKHYGRAYMRSASVVASGEGIAGERGGGGGTISGGGRAGAIKILHETASDADRLGPSSTVTLAAPPDGMRWGRLDFTAYFRLSATGSYGESDGVFWDAGTMRASTTHLRQAGDWRRWHNADESVETYSVGGIQSGQTIWYSLEYNPATREVSFASVNAPNGAAPLVYLLVVGEAIR